MQLYNPDKIWEPVDFTIYFKFIKWPVLAAIVLEIIFRWWSGSGDSGGSAFLGLSSWEIMMWLWRIVIFSFIGWRVYRVFGRHLIIAAISGSLAGAGVGLVMAFFRFFAGIKVWKFFNLFTETFLTALVGALVVIVIMYLLAWRLGRNK